MQQLSTHEEAEIPMPINSSYVGSLHGHHGHGNMTNHHHLLHNHPQLDHHPPSSSHVIPPPSSSTPSPHVVPANGITTNLEENNNAKLKKVVIRYRECQKNHAACMGGNARDGCGEFMPSGEEGSIEALTCSACNCHRNFHRREVEGEMVSQFYPSDPHHSLISTRGRKVILGGGGGGAVPISMAYQVGGQNCNSVPCSDQSDEHDHHMHHHHHAMMMIKPHHHHHNHVVKKRFRTKFSQEQKEKMLDFAEKVGWKIQKQEEAVVQQFCQEIGVKRRVLKVWMHNNKHSLAKKNNDTTNIINHSPSTI